MHLALAPTEPYLVLLFIYIFLLFIVNINMPVGDDVHLYFMSYQRPNDLDDLRRGWNRES